MDLKNPMLSEQLIKKLVIEFDFKVYEVLELYAEERIQLLNKQLQQDTNPTALFQLQGAIRELSRLRSLKGIVEDSLNGGSRH
jgi:hypothetical protein